MKRKALPPVLERGQVKLEDCVSACKIGSDALLVTIDHAIPMTRAWRRSSFPRPYIWRLTNLSLQI